MDIKILFSKSKSELFSPPTHEVDPKTPLFERYDL